MNIKILILLIATLAAGCKSKPKPSPIPQPAPPAPVVTPKPVPAPQPVPVPPTSTPIPPTPAPTPPPPKVDTSVPHVVLVIDENRKLSDVLANMPWLIQMGNTYAHLMNMHSTESGSLKNYIVLSSGSNEGCNGNSCLWPITSDNIYVQLDKKGLSWKVYAEGLPSAGSLVASAGNYVKRHNPAVWYASVLNNKQDLAKIVPFKQFAIDLKSDNLPNYSVVIPDLTNDAHGAGSLTNSKTLLVKADNWLKTNIGPVFDSPFFQDDAKGIVVVTFDECGGGTNSGCGASIYSAILGPRAIVKSASNKNYNHFDILRTIEEFLGLDAYSGNAARAHYMDDVVKK